jgi:hypothetical protein
MLTAHQLNHFFMDELHLCGCGSPEAAACLVRDILRLCPLYDNRKGIEELLPNDGVQYLILGWLTDTDLLEHGGGIGGSWLTDKGKTVLASLEEISKADAELETIFPDSTEPPPDECDKCYPKELSKK